MSICESEDVSLAIGSLPETCWVLEEMAKVILMITLAAGLACADEAADRVAVTRMVAAAAPTRKSPIC